MPKIRIIPKLEIKGLNVIKGMRMEGLRVVGLPEEFSKKYYLDSADEILFIDTVASLYGRNNLQGLDITNDGTKMFLTMNDRDGNQSVKKYNFATPYDLTTITIDPSAIVLQKQNPFGIFFGNNGKRLFVSFIGVSPNKGIIEQYTLDTAYDLSSFTLDGQIGLEEMDSDLDDLINESRQLKGSDEKKNPQDFALWKKAGKKHIMKWNSPWGEGFPGWHIECSAMGHKYLGKQFDIHGGGIDLKFPHHDCEIAQSESVYGNNPANYWIHTNMLTLNGKKMSKSLGNSVFPNEIFYGSNKAFSKKFSPMTLKFFMYQAHYRNTLDISNDALLAAEKGFQKIKNLNEEISTIYESKKNDFNASAWVNECYEALNDDFNSPKLIAKLFDLHKTVSEIKNRTKSIDLKNKKILIRFYKVFYSEILGLDDDNLTQEKFDEILELILELREKERLSKNYEKSDYIRDKLSELGVKINDKI